MHHCLTIHSKLVLPLLAPWLLVLGAPEHASFDAHKWEVAEIFSNADGTIQYVEWFNTDDDENLLSFESISTNGGFYAFPNNLPSTNTSNRRFLMATAAFAALPGAPTPDYIIPAGLINRNGDTIDYSGGDSISFGALPSDGVTARNRNGQNQANSPTNFAGVTGSIDASSTPATFANFGAGCPNGPGGATMGVTANAPVLGSNFVITFTDKPSPAVIALLGLSTEIGFGVAGTPALPFELSPFGLPGCSLLVSADIDTVFLPTGDWVIPLPNSPQFDGLEIHVQGFAEAPGANALGFITSNAGSAVLGN